MYRRTGCGRSSAAPPKNKPPVERIIALMAQTNTETHQTSGFDCDIGGLFEGYGGLTLATQTVLGRQLGWYSEIDPAASRVLTHHHPTVPNLGDITTIDWAAVPRPRILTGGFPCQDVSAAGQRVGLRPGSRSGLWTHMAYAIAQLQPQLVVIENVRGLLSAEAHSDLEPCPWCLGDNPDSALRACGAVLGDLVNLGYDTRWGGLRAADVGAPHGRCRIFITAWPGDADPDTARGGRRTAGRHDGLRTEGLVAGTASDPERDRRHEGRPEPVRDTRRTEPACGDRRTPAHPDSVGPVRDGRTRRRRAGSTNHDLTAAHTEGERRTGGISAPPDMELHRPQLTHLGTHGDRTRWGDYAPAIHRWEQVTGRPAPNPTITGTRGGQQLSAQFVEWMMGLPAGYVTAVPGISRNEQLKMLGNGVVLQQAEEALRWLLADADEEAAA